MTKFSLKSHFIAFLRQETKGIGRFNLARNKGSRHSAITIWEWEGNEQEGMYVIVI